MQNSKLQIKNKKAFRQYVDWRVKIGVLKDQIAELEKFKKISVFAIALFLLKTQIIEFELKQLITKLDLHLSFSNCSKILKMRVKTPKDMDEQRMTLGILKRKLDEYTGKFLGNLQRNLRELNKFRVKFVHQLFSQGSTDELITEAKKALDVANEVINNIELVNNFLDKNDPHKK